MGVYCIEMKCKFPNIKVVIGATLLKLLSMVSRGVSKGLPVRFPEMRSDEEIVISGISGRFPRSDDMNSFRENLFNKVDMVTSDGNMRWDMSHPDLPQRFGTVNRIEKFDAGFFGIHKREADIMEPMYRMLMEKVLEAIYDAGFNPKELEGTRCGVYVNTIHSDSQCQMVRHDLKAQCHAFTGLVRAILPNRISYILKIKGPSCVIDTACSSSLHSLNEAYEDMKHGRVDTAIVGTAVLNLHPLTAMQFFKLGVLSLDGACKVFDDSANGYARAETISAIFLQKSSCARRIYSRVIHCKSNCDGYKEQGISYPSANEQKNLLTEFYKECKINPATIDYMEAHGTGTSVGDCQEIRPIDEIFCKGRSTPLPIGSVKSNMGHAEPGAGHCQIAKIIIAMETGIIPPNLHFREARKGALGLKSGRIQVVTEKTPFAGQSGLVAVSSFGFGGANSHTLLKWNDKANINAEKLGDEAPRLVCVSGRTKESVEAILEKTEPVNVEFIALLHQIFKYDIPGHGYRGFAIVSKDGGNYKSIRKNCASKPDFYLTLGEPNDQILRQAAELLDLPVARSIFERVEKVVFPLNKEAGVINRKKVDVDELSAILVTATVQIAFLEILKALSVEPKVVKASFCNELIQDFANGNLSLEETIAGIYNVANDLVNKNNRIRQCREIVTKKRENNTVSIVFDTFTENGLVFGLQNQENCLVSLLKIIGRLYEFGYNPQIHKIYPNVEFPVSRGTPMISLLIQWNHQEDWFVLSFRDNAQKKEIFERVVSVSIKENDWSFVAGHVVDGRNQFPASGYLFIVWETFAASKRKITTEMEIVFENVRFDRATNIPKHGKAAFLVSIRKGTGCFEVIEDDACIVKGRIGLRNDLKNSQYNKTFQLESRDEIVPNERDVYKELRLRGYNYSGLFKSIRQCDPDFRRATVEWHQNWIAFMDNMLQVQILNLVSRDLFVPTFIKEITIDAKYHLQFAARHKDSLLPVYYYKEFNALRSGGIEVKGLTTTAISRKRKEAPVLEKYVFVPNKAFLTPEDSIRVNIQIVFENTYRIKLNIAEIEEEDVQSLAHLIVQVCHDQPLIQTEILTVQKGGKFNVKNCLLCVGCNLLQNSDILEEAFNLIVRDGFVLSREALGSIIDDSFAEILTVHETPAELMVLLKKPRRLPTPKALSIDYSGWIPELQKLLKEDDNVVIYSRKRPCGILGLVNCLRKEPGGEACRCVFIEDDSAPRFDYHLKFYLKQLNKAFAINVYKNGQWGTYRHLPLKEELVTNKQHSYVDIMTKGDLASLKWIEGPLSKGDKSVTVYYSSLNFRDIMTATGRIQYSTSIGLDERGFLQGIEFSGIDTNGQRVMGMIGGGALATRLAADEDLLHPVPEKWSLEEAATVPIVYLTVLFSLLEKGNMKKGQSILIHAGSGGIGQAAINIAFYHGLEIFTTVGSKEKREFIRNNFPFIKESHIGNSRDSSFEQMVMKVTKGRGVDLVLNSLAEEKLQASLRCLAKGGRFLEIGKFDLMNESNLNLELFKREATFHGIHLDGIFHTNHYVKRRLMDMLRRGIENGAVKPLSRIVYGVDEVERAFRFMARGGHIGKVLIKIKEEETLRLCNVSSTIIPAASRYYCDPNDCCVVTGGLGGFGLELIDWLVKRGARKIVVSSRNGVKNGYQASRIRLWRTQGAEVIISKSNILSREGCEALLQEANMLGPVTSIFHLAVVLADALFDHQTEESFRKVAGPKAAAAIHLDQISRSLCQNLRDFVVFSSVSCGRGNAGQTNYGMTNSVMERICENRKSVGLPGLAIQWGAIGDVGLVAEMKEEAKLLAIDGTLQQSISSCLEVLDRLLNEQQAAVVSSIVVAEKRSASGRADNIVEAVASIIGVGDIKTVSLHSPLPELGMDSMMATEIKQGMEKEFDIFMTVKDVRSLTFAKLHEIMSDKAAAELQKPEDAKKRMDDYESFVKGVGTQESEKQLLLRIPSSVPIDEEALFVYMFPGVEGFFSPLEVLASNLPFQTFCFQYCSEHFTEVTVFDIAKKLITSMESKILERGSFNFVAHSFGCLVALEMASLLENHGVFGQIVLIDGSPKATVNLVKQQFGDLNDDEIQLKILEGILSNHLPTQGVNVLMEELSLQSSREARMELFLSRLPISADENSEYYKYLARMGEKRLRAVMTYKPTYLNIQSKIFLCKPTEQSIVKEDEDYGLSQISENFKVRYFKGNHLSILKNDDLWKTIPEELLKM